MKLLSDSFLAKYRHQTPKNAGVLFYPVYLRTYSRWLEDKQRRERWDETVERVVEYSLSLYQGPAQRAELEAEAELLYDHIFNLKVLPAGRTLWVGGTESSRKFGESQFNCSALVVDDIESIGDLFQLLLCGCGVGFRVLKEDVAKLPAVHSCVGLMNYDYRHGEDEHMFPELTCKERTFATVQYHPSQVDVHISVGDSREAWVEALRIFLSWVTTKLEDWRRVQFFMTYNRVRPKGSRIQSFGGQAPGPHGLMEMFDNLTSIVERSGGRLSTVDVLDICNFIAKNVIVGGTRRSSQIALGSADDLEFIEAKKGLWVAKKNLQRTMSNNSVVFEGRPEFSKVREIFEGIKNNGEPGFFNIKAANERRPNVSGINPCAEILLSDKGFCNLTTINLMAFVEDGIFNFHGAAQAISLATRIGCRMTNVTVSLPEWDKVQKRDRLLGVSMTGIMDAFDALGVEFDSPYAINLLAMLRNEANDEAAKYAYEMRIPCPLLVTAIKPEGTLSQLPTVSSGLHRAYAPYFIRRIRVSAMDPVCKALQKLGVPNEPDQGKAERIVFSFPIKTEASISANEEPARRQFERYLAMMEHYVDHNASCTLTIGDNEWEEMENLVYDNFDKIVACAFLPKYTDAFPQMPYEEITKEQYEEFQAQFPNLDSLPDLVNSFEVGELKEEELEVDPACGVSGQCPVR